MHGVNSIKKRNKQKTAWGVLIPCWIGLLVICFALVIPLGTWLSHKGFSITVYAVITIFFLISCCLGIGLLYRNHIHKDTTN